METACVRAQCCIAASDDTKEGGKDSSCPILIAAASKPGETIRLSSYSMQGGTPRTELFSMIDDHCLNGKTKHDGSEP
jgi:hypothetical protein